LVIGSLALVAFLPFPPPDRYVVLPVDGLRFETPAAPAEDGDRMGFAPGDFDAYLALDGAGEAYLDFSGKNEWDRDPRHPLRCAFRLPDDAPAAGRLFVAKADHSGFEARRFAIPAGAADTAAKDAFLEIAEEHYQELLDRGIPGAAWFRHQADTYRRARAKSPGAPSRGTPGVGWMARRPEGLEDSLDLFSGERALAENLDLDRTLRIPVEGDPTIDVATIEGVTTRAMDWKALIAGMKPDLDPLAAWIPADQHAVFFPSFQAMVRVFDEIDRAGTPLVEFASSRAEDQKTKERYQEQLCLPLSSVSRLVGPAVVESVAITGSDPFLPSGTDLALIFRCKDAALLEKLVQARHLEARAKGAKPVEGSAGKLAYAGVRSDDRRISSYLARSADTIVVANSPAALERIAAATEGRATALAAADEYVWFRDRYKRSDASESALLVLTDATIRRWASPAARIGDARRIRVAAAMAEVHARHADALATGRIGAGTSAAEPDLPSTADLVWEKEGVRSPVHGTPTFLTPLIERPVTRVSAEEKQAYEAFRRTFQDRWRAFFDPIALRLSFTDGKLGADLSVMPLVVESEYKDFRDLTLDATLAPTAGDPHSGTLFHFAMAFGKRSPLSRLFSREAGPFAQQLGADPLGWIGGGVALYADQDPFWKELSDQKDRNEFMEGNVYRLPLALHVDVKDPLKLAAFLTGLRAMADGAAPGMVRWETKTWHEQAYVRIAPAEGVDLPNAAITYAAMPDAFVLSLREEVVQRAIDRRLERKQGKSDAGGGKAWLGSSLALRIERDAIALLADTWTGSAGDELRRTAWAALPILNEWKRLFPGEDPVAVHERVFGTRLGSPGGGTFAWNDAMQTMETSDYGCPAAPKSGPQVPAVFDSVLRGDFGLSFEGEGLRARVELERSAK
jgi:hypothetical protein